MPIVPKEQKVLLALRISADLVSPTRREGNYVAFKGRNDECKCYIYINIFVGTNSNHSLTT